MNQRSDPNDGMVLKSFKVPPELWADARAAAEWRGDPSVSEVIRRALASYVKNTNRRRDNTIPNQRRSEQ